MYIFSLGNTPSFSLLELQAFFPEQQFTSLTPQLVAADLPSFDAVAIMNQLGGTVKISQVVQEISPEQLPDLLNIVTDYLVSQAIDNKLTFSFNIFAPAEQKKTLSLDLDNHDLKHALKQQELQVRFINSGSQGLTAAVLLHQANLCEVNLIYTEANWLLVRTLAVQDIDDWTKRDRGKPYFDRKKGMLPPKVARMMVNLGLGFWHQPQSSQLATDAKTEPTLVNLYDPFCGSGTILMEAISKNCFCLGSDLDQQAVFGTIANLDWLCQKYQLPTRYEVFQAEVSQVKPSKMVDVIVTEPFLGRQTPDAKQVPNLLRGLEKLYLGAFSAWRKILVDGAIVVIIFPIIEISGKIYNLNNFVDKLRAKGYTRLVEPVVYAREGAIVKREINVFRFKK